MTSGGVKIGIKVMLKGGLLLAGIGLMAGAAIGDSIADEPNKFAVLFGVGGLSIVLGLLCVWKLGHD